MTQQEIDLLSPPNSESVKTLPDGALELLKAGWGPVFEAILSLADTFEGVSNSPYPRI
jgi:hypothetical protein